MACPHNINGSASQLFFQKKDSPEFRALLVISSLPHPQRELLSTFVLSSADHDVAAQFMLEEISKRDGPDILEFLANWTSLVKKIRPVVAKALDSQEKQIVWQRDGGTSCISRIQNKGKEFEDYVFAFIVPPSLFSDCDTGKHGELLKMLEAFIGEESVTKLHAIIDQSSKTRGGCSDQLLLLSNDAFSHFENGRLSMKAMSSSDSGDSARYFLCKNQLIPFTPVAVRGNFIDLKNKSAGLASLPSPLLLDVHHRFSGPLSWIEVSEYAKYHPKRRQQRRISLSISRYFRPVLRVLRCIWQKAPVSIRSYVCESLARIGHRCYGATLSDRTHHLPFNLYLRIASADWGPRHQAEFESLRLVEQYTRVPAPRPVDTFRHRDKSYFLMTSVPGRPIGTLLDIMSDEQIRKAVQDLRRYVAELRQIPNKTCAGFKICNALGGGILDWRIGDSQREDLKFVGEAEFHQYLTSTLDEETQEQALKAHGKRHDIVFTHCDLNPRNILADDSGTITGIVDWECSGWFPEYWEYTKAHFAVRYTIRWLADVIDQVFANYREELRVENMLSSMAPPF